MSEGRESGTDEVRRCGWVNLKNPAYVAYHDHEWGRARPDEHYLYEMFVLETFQAGLSWECVLNKRVAFRKAYDDFSLEKVCGYDETKIEELMQNPGIIRNRRKIVASIKNSQIYREICQKFGSFHAYIDSFSGGKVIFEHDRTTNQLSNHIAHDLKERGMIFVGSTTIYAYLQSVGVINSHLPECYLYI